MRFIIFKAEFGRIVCTRMKIDKIRVPFLFVKANSEALIQKEFKRTLLPNYKYRNDKE